MRFLTSSLGLMFLLLASSACVEELPDPRAMRVFSCTCDDGNITETYSIKAATASEANAQAEEICDGAFNDCSCSCR